MKNILQFDANEWEKNTISEVLTGAKEDDDEKFIEEEL